MINNLYCFECLHFCSDCWTCFQKVESIQHENENIKITVRFLSNEIRSDAVDINIFYKKCITINNCTINKQEGQLKKELAKKILAKATIYQKQNKDKNFKPYNNQSTPGD